MANDPRMNERDGGIRIPIPNGAHHPTVPPAVRRVDRAGVDGPVDAGPVDRPRLRRAARACAGPFRETSLLGYSWLGSWLTGAPIVQLRTADGSPLRCCRESEEYEAVRQAFLARLSPKDAQEWREIWAKEVSR